MLKLVRSMLLMAVLAVLFRTSFSSCCGLNNAVPIADLYSDLSSSTDDEGSPHRRRRPPPAGKTAAKNDAKQTSRRGRPPPAGKTAAKNDAKPKKTGHNPKK
ncbi:uncharacterized protein LOC111055486 [Nilaparvata lugens]|uniref:uncharacterized protein LOC111055486 n=1 Tax=Nilaparvata lugens TaxID=108931 RepID=UPI00193E06B3|nr:uncharacterized protein LOC111055486 [Nilaparvata lugens]XP_039281486.1 uncharacterized protein LOC111055486 [Nilaparvata lugens]